MSHNSGFSCTTSDQMVIYPGKNRTSQKVTMTIQYMDQASCAGVHISFSLNNSHRSCCLSLVYHTHIFLVYFLLQWQLLKTSKNLKKSRCTQRHNLDDHVWPLTSGFLFYSCTNQGSKTHTTYCLPTSLKPEGDFVFANILHSPAEILLFHSGVR